MLSNDRYDRSMKSSHYAFDARVYRSRPYDRFGRVIDSTRKARDGYSIDLVRVSCVGVWECMHTSMCRSIDRSIDGFDGFYRSTDRVFDRLSAASMRLTLVIDETAFNDTSKDIAQGSRGRPKRRDRSMTRARGRPRRKGGARHSFARLVRRSQCPPCPRKARSAPW